MDASITYDDGSAISEGDVLKAGKTQKIKVSLSYVDGLDSSSYPTTNQTYNINIGLNYEQYTGTMMCKVTFDPNDGEVSPTYMDVQENGSLSTWPEATRTNYVFDGWFTAKNGGEELTTTTRITDDVTYYAHWHSANSAVYMNNTYYDTISTAITNLPNNTETEIKLLKDITLTTAITFANNKNATMVIDGVTINVYGKRQPVYNKGGTLTIQGNSQFTTTTSERPVINNLDDGTTPGNITIISGTFISPKYSAIKLEGASTLTIGTDDSNINAADPVLQGYTYGVEIASEATGSINFYDGILKGVTAPISSSITTTATQVSGIETIGTDTYNTLHLQ